MGGRPPRPPGARPGHPARESRTAPSGRVEKLLAPISGGRENKASNIASSVSGGFKNEAIGELASVSGGEKNKATGAASWIGSGLENEVLYEHLIKNKEGRFASIFGGKHLTTVEDYAAIP